MAKHSQVKYECQRMYSVRQFEHILTYMTEDHLSMVIKSGFCPTSWLSRLEHVFNKVKRTSPEQ